TGEDFRILLEDLIIFTFTRVNARCKAELDQYSGQLRVPERPFNIYSSESLRAQHGENFEQIISELSEDPFWITDFAREFYDKEDPVRPGHYINYDLIYPMGFNEALSGGERDYQYDILLRKICERNQEPKKLAAYLDLAKENKLVPSVGGGLGVERLLRFITKLPNIEDACLFPRVPGKKVLF
ncbi:MAG: amino acid--tRNA ligase-related protein, partial [Promethearchaeota archaeon]